MNKVRTNTCILPSAQRKLFFFLSILNRFLFPYKLNNLQSERENKNKHKNTKFLHAPHTRTHTET